MQVLHGAFAVFAAMHIDQIYRRPCGAVMHPRATQIEVIGRVAPKQGHLFTGDGQHILDQGAGKPDAIIGAEDRACADQNLDPRRRGIGQTDFFQRAQGSFVDAQHLGLGQRVVAPARHARADRPGVSGQWGGPGGVTGGPAPGAAGDPAGFDRVAGQGVVNERGCAGGTGLVSHAGSPIGGRNSIRQAQASYGRPRAARPRRAPMVRSTNVIRQNCVVIHRSPISPPLSGVFGQTACPKPTFCRFLTVLA